MEDTADPRESKPRRAHGVLWIVVILAIVTAAGGWFYYSRLKAAEAKKQPAPQPVQVVAVTVERKDVPIYLDGLGTVQAFNTVSVRSQVDGQLVKIAFREGQDVKKGDLLAQIDPQPFQAQLEQAQAKKLQDEAKIVQDQAKLAQDQANLANSRVNLKRFEDSAIAFAVTAESVSDQRAAVAQLEALVRADDAAIRVDEAAVKADQAAIEYAQVQLAYTTILSPIDGRTGVRQMDVGNIVHISDVNPIVVITQLQPISMIFTLPQQDLVAINERMTQERLAVIAVSGDGTAELDRGLLELVDNQVDQSTGTIRLKATFPNAKFLLWPGGFVNARLFLETRRDATTVEAPAIQQGATGTLAFVIGADQKVQARPVKVSLIQDNVAVIDSGLQPGDRVVLLGQDRLKPGSAVVEAPAKESPAPGATEKAIETSTQSGGGNEAR